MYQLIILLLLFFTLTSAQAQIPNANFEEWEVIDTFDKPVSWKINLATIHTHHALQFDEAIEEKYSLHLLVPRNTSPNVDWIVETTFLPDQIYKSLHASIRIDSIDWGRSTIEIAELKDGAYQRIGFWQTEEVTDGVEHISIPINQTQTDSLRIRMTTYIFAFIPLPAFYSQLIVDELELSTLSSGEEPTIPSIAFNIFPNPARHYLHISTQDMPLPFDLQLFDALGRQVLQEQVWVAEQEINIEALPPGTYWYRVVQKDEMLTRGKVVVY